MLNILKYTSWLIDGTNTAVMMATAPDVSFTKAKSNYLRLFRATTDLGIEVLRIILSQSVSPIYIVQEVQRSKLKPNKHQWQIINSISGDYKELDISILYYLIRGLRTDLKPTRGWDPSYPPTASEVTLGDDVERIHFIRNYITAHINEVSLLDKAFQDHLEELDSVMARIDVLYGSNFQESLLTISIDIMDLETIKREHLKDLKQNQIDEWEKDEKTFIETKAFKKIACVVKGHTLTVITGPPGSGKSAIGHHKAILLQNEDYQIVPVESLEDLESSWIQGSKQVFVMDDVFGVPKLDEVELGKWFKRINQLQICLKNNKILISMRKQFSLDKRLKSLFSQFKHSVVDISDKDLALTKNERGNMFLKHMSAVGNATKCNNIIRNCDLSCFPLLCRLFADKESKYELGSFFKNPLSVIKTEVELMKDNKDIRYLGLVLCIINDNKLSENVFEIGEESNETRNKREDFAECCGFSRSISRQKIKTNLESLIGTYVLKESGYYIFIHDIIYDVVINTLTSEYHSLILKHCSSKFISQRLVFSSSSVHCKDNSPLIVLDDRFQQKWVDRMISDVENGNYYDVFLNICLQDEAIEEVFLNSLISKDMITSVFFEKIQLSEDTSDDIHSSLLNTIKQHNEDLLFIFMTVISLTRIHLLAANKMNKTFAYVYQHCRTKIKNLISLRDLLYIACLRGNEFVFNLLFEEQFKHESWNPDFTFLCVTNGGNLNILQQIIKNIDDISDLYLYYCLFLASCNGHDKIIQTLLTNKANVNSSLEDIYPSLHLAAQNRHDFTVQLLVDNRVSFDNNYKDGFTRLHSASENGHDRTEQILIDIGARVNYCYNNVVTLLHLASQKGHDSTVQILIDNGASVDYGNKDGFTPLHSASENGHYSIVQILIDNGASVNYGDKDGFTALHLASEIGHDSIVQILIDNGASVDYGNKDGFTALHLASANGHDSTVKILIDNGASVDYGNKDGFTPLHSASANGHDSIVQILIDNGDSVNYGNKDGFTALHLAAEKRHDSTVQILIDNGASVDYGNKDSFTALHSASGNGHDSIVQILIDNGASVDYENKDGFTALHLAAEKRHDSIVQILIDNGASVDYENKDGFTPLHSASGNGHDSIVQILIDNGASVNNGNKDGFTPLHLASGNRHDSTVQILIDNGATVNNENKDGFTALHLASQNGHESIVQILIDKGAILNICNKNGITALHLASYDGHCSTVQILIKHGSNINKRSNNNVTPLYFASRNGHVTTVQTLINSGADVHDLGPFMTVINK
ncbi:hypothetical protein KUTeg_024545 [Tegillarca granosa]|uniref:DZIP3-like HEPN domain-containing protein n=1 Tax=Tegillarca granosa TaxID=220873 RepID=A0ABQ9DY69_TEGGR|nr:hypothetical protein KUTeg_024545 [Tegillarca granosa]